MKTLIRSSVLWYLISDYIVLSGLSIQIPVVNMVKIKFYEKYAKERPCSCEVRTFDCGAEDCGF